MIRANLGAQNKIGNCSFCGCRTCIVQHWTTDDTKYCKDKILNRYLGGDACRDCIPWLESLTPQEGEDLLTARIVAQKLEFQ